MRGWVVIALVAGCGRFGFGGSGSGSGDAAAMDDSSGAKDGDVTGDGPQSDGTPSGDAPACSGTTHTLVDNFDDNTFSGLLWGRSYEDSGSTHVETNGRLEIHLGTNVSDNWAGYVSTNLYELKDDRVFVEVPVVNAFDGNAVLLLWTSLAKTDGPSIEYERGHLIMRRRVSDVINDYANITYSPTMDRWWQIRERGGVTYWETSPDGVMWTVRFQQATPGATSALITLAAGTGTPIAQADLVAFDNFNGGGSPPGCP